MRWDWSVLIALDLFLCSIVRWYPINLVYFLACLCFFPPFSGVPSLAELFPSCNYFLLLLLAQSF